ncbi:MAG: VWA domain-containing protein [Ruminococcaceae bacterium]|nr:VWA domain-containing protein [Oscillospiraceae bacterium]
MSNIELTFEHPWFMLLAIPMIAVVLLPFLLLPKNRRKTFKKIAPVVLHCVIVLLLVLIISGFSILHHTNEESVMLLLDLSYSTKNVQSTILDHTEELLDLIDQNIPVGVIAFGEDQVYNVTLESDSRELQLHPLSVEATNIQAALEYAASLAPKDKAYRIIVMSDGKETDGNAEDTAYKLAAKGIRIDAVYYDTTRIYENEIQISSFLGPEGIYVNREATFVAELKSTLKSNVTLTLYDNDTVMVTQNCSLNQGSNVIELKTTPQSAGMHTFRLVLDTQTDTLPQNNIAYTFLPISDQPSVLIIADRVENASALADILSEENSVTTVSARTAPDSLVKLCKYDEVILSNVSYFDLPRGYDVMLERYVADYGRTLLAVGGKDTFMYGNMQSTALKDMLPVELMIKENIEANSVALMLVLDCSSSMKGEYISIAKQGALNCLSAMTDNDEVGVVSFSKEAKLESTLIRASDSNKEELTRVISGLELGNGTYYTEAIKLAHQELLKSEATIKHIIFLSDGQPSDKDYYEAVINANQNDVTVSTIGLGYSSYILDNIATYGKGRYYYVYSAEELPDIMLSETEQAKISSLIIQNTVPVIKEDSALTNTLGTANLPALDGYLGTTLKEDANAYLTTAKNHPIFASWTYGFGTVACFTSDLNGTWSSRWLSEGTGKQLILSMVKTTVDDVHNDSSLIVNTDVHSSTAHISVSTANTNSNNKLSMTVHFDDNSEMIYDLTQIYPGMYETVIPISKEGIYDLTITEFSFDNRLIDSTQTAMAVSYSEEYDAFAADGKLLLMSLCSYSNGDIFTDMKKLAGVSMPGIHILYNPIIPIAILTAILLLADIAIRKLRLKDLEKYWTVCKKLFSKNK